MQTLRFAMGFTAAMLLSISTAKFAPAAILYQFTTVDTQESAGYKPEDVTTTIGSNVVAPNGGSALALGDVGLDRFRNSEWNGFTLSAANGTTLDNVTEFATGYFTWTVSAAPGYLLNLESLTFGSARGGATNTRGFEIYGAIDGGVFTFGDTPLLDIGDESGTRGTPTPRSINLSGAAYQGIESITFRYYPLTTAVSGTIDFSGMTLNGEVVPVPEPSTLALALGGFAGLCFVRRRK